MTFTSVDQSLLGPYQSSANTFLGMGRNRIVNGAMVIAQENAGTLTTFGTGVGSRQPADGVWIGGPTSGFGTGTVNRLSATPPTGFVNYINITITNPDVSGLHQYTCDLQRIEGYMIRDFMLGTSQAKTFTLSFWTRSSLTGTFSGGIQNASATRSYVFTYVINSANTWEKKTITISGDLTGTWSTDNTACLYVRLSMGTASSHYATPGSWLAGDFYESNQVGTVEIIGTNGATQDFTGVQLELGTSATPFEFRLFALDLILCQRYFEKSYAVDIAVGSTTTSNPWQSTAVNGTGACWSAPINYVVEKRTFPTVTLYDFTGTTGQWSWSTAGSAGTVRVTSPQTSNGVMQTKYFTVRNGVTATDNFASGHWTSDARL